LREDTGQDAILVALHQTRDTCYSRISEVKLCLIWKISIRATVITASQCRIEN